MGLRNERVHRLLALLDRPHKLERFPLALELKAVLGAPTALDAVRQVIEGTFAASTPMNRQLLTAIVFCNVDGNKSSHAAAMLNVSLRTLFRRRSEAISAVASAIDKLLHSADSDVAFKRLVARMIAPIESKAAVELLETESATLGPGAAYEAVCSTVRNGRNVAPAVLKKCTGHWHLLAKVEIARAELYRGHAGAYEHVSAEIREELRHVRGVEYDRVEFELANADRLYALRRCDIDASAAATRRMAATAGRDPQLATLALVSEAEQACDEGDLIRAHGMIRELQSLCTQMQDYRTTARTSHIAGTLHFLLGQYDETIKLCSASSAALALVEPEFAACSAANAGRAALFTGRSWTPPFELCKKFARSYVTAFVEAVWARHLALDDPMAALAAADQAMNLAASQHARGVLSYARATRAIVLDILGREDEAQHERITAWTDATRMRRVFYLYDLFCHPAVERRGFGPFNINQDFANAIGRRFLDESNGAVRNGELDEWITPALLVCFYASQIKPVPAPQARQRSAAQRISRRAVSRMVGRDRPSLLRASRTCAVDLAYCLEPSKRTAFSDRFGAAASKLWNRESVWSTPLSN